MNILLGFGYTRTESYDGTTCDNPDSTAGQDQLHAMTK